MGLRCAQHTPHEPNLAQPSAKMRTRWPNFGQYRPHQGSKKEKERDREPNLKIQKSRIKRVCVGHGTFSSLSLLLCLFHSLSPFPLFVCICLCLRPGVSLSLPLFFVSLSFTFFPSLAVFLSPLSFASVSVAVSVGSCPCLFPYPCYQVVGEHRSPTLVYDGGRDFGRPGSILRKKGADRPGVHCAHRRSGEPSNTTPARHQGATEVIVDRKDSVHQNYRQKGGKHLLYTSYASLFAEACEIRSNW